MILLVKTSQNAGIRESKGGSKMDAKWKRLTTFGLTTGILALTGLTVQAQGEIDTSVVDEAWGKPTYVYGGGLTSDQVDETADLLGIDNRDNVNESSVEGQDLQKYLKQGVGSTSSMISSVLVQRRADNTGVEVNVVTPDNITRISDLQYANAAITAGVEDAQIMVAAIRPVTGESALTGVYKAFELNGQDLEGDRMEVAQEELETTEQISKGLDQADQAKLNQAIADIKRDLAELKDRVDGLPSQEDIQEIVNQALANHNLSQVVSPEQVDQLIVLFVKYQETSAIDSNQVLQQLERYSQDLKAKAGDLIEEAENRGIFDAIRDFFRQLWQALQDLFN